MDENHCNDFKKQEPENANYWMIHSKEHSWYEPWAWILPAFSWCYVSDSRIRHQEIVKKFNAQL